MKEEYIDTGKVHFTFREFPLQRLDYLVFALSRCAADENGGPGYFAMLSTLFRNQNTWMGANRDAEILKYAAQAGITENEFRTCVVRPEITQKIKSNQEAGQAAGVNSTPSFVLNGEKTWISNGGIADFYCLFARTGEAPGAKGLSAFIVQADLPGFEIAERLHTIAPHPLARLKFTDCRIPASSLMGKGGDGFKIAMSVLDVFRSTVAAAALGFARRALDETITRVQDRQLFGAPLFDLQMVQGHVADMALDIDASALLVYRAAWLKDSGAPRVSREAAMAKLYSTDHAQTVIDKAVQIHGGDGVRSGHIVETLYREIRALRIYEGASDVQKIIIARQTLAQ